MEPFTPPRYSQYNDLLVVQNDQQINLKSTYGISTLRDAITGTVTNTGSEFRLQTGAVAEAVSRLESAERGCYVAGQDSCIGMGIRVSATPVGTQDAMWGYFDANGGFGYGVDATGVYIFRRLAGIDTKVYQSDWNKNKLDGANNSSFTLDLAEGNVFHLEFSWYGFGTISWNVIMRDARTNAQTVINIHKDRVLGAPSVDDPNLPITAQILNGADDTPFDSLYVAGRQFSTRGVYKPTRRITSGRALSKTSIGTTFLPVVSMRRKGSFRTVSAKITGLDLITDGPILVQLRENATLTGSSYSTPEDQTATETALEVDNTASAVSGGTVIWESIVNTSGSGSHVTGQASMPIIDQEFLNLRPITLCVRRITGTNATVSAVLRVGEEW
jgi:hypothetical protein